MNYNNALHRICVDKSSCRSEQENHIRMSDLTKDVFRKQYEQKANKKTKN